MKKWFSLFMTVILFLSCVSCTAESSGGTPPYEAAYVLFAVSAGKADALILKAEEHFYLIDTGYTRSRGKILYAMELLGTDRLDGVFITHTDNDHTNGLEWLAESGIPIGAWYAPAMYTGVGEEKHPAQKAAAARGETVIWLKAGDSLDLGNATLDILAPGVLFDDKDNNNSLVMMLRTPYGRMLLCGDMEYREEAWLLDSGEDIRCDVIKIPDHADDDVCSQRFIDAASPSVAVISTDTREKPETPDPALMRRLLRACDIILQTQHAAAGVTVSLLPDRIETGMVSLPACRADIGIFSISPDTVILRNNGNETADLSGWYMIGDRKKTVFVFPEQTFLLPGRQFTVGGKSAKGPVDCVWNEKKLIKKAKNDGITLYDRYGNTVSYMSSE